MLLPVTRPVYVSPPALKVMSSPRIRASVIGVRDAPDASSPEIIWKRCDSAS
jgi:hypothetical protein